MSAYHLFPSPSRPSVPNSTVPFFSRPGSHKKRDNRCGIAAPKLEHGSSIFGIPLFLSTSSDSIIIALIKSLEAHGWDADTQVEHPSLTMGLPLEDLNVTPEERDENIAEQLKQSAESKRALIVKVSHVGGHKYAGNCIVSLLFSGT